MDTNKSNGKFAIKVFLSDFYRLIFVKIIVFLEVIFLNNQKCVNFEKNKNIAKGETNK